MKKIHWSKGDTFKAYSRGFTVNSVDSGGVWTVRDDGEKGFFEWPILALDASDRRPFNPPHFQETDK